MEVRIPHFAAEPESRDIVVVPTDLMPESRAAVQLGFNLARALPIDLHLLHVIPESLHGAA